MHEQPASSGDLGTWADDTTQWLDTQREPQKGYTHRQAILALERHH
ncbi:MULTISPECIES: hypothetical protein [unclassified Streptomyces]